MCLINIFDIFNDTCKCNTEVTVNTQTGLFIGRHVKHVSICHFMFIQDKAIVADAAATIDVVVACIVSECPFHHHHTSLVVLQLHSTKWYSVLSAAIHAHT